MGCGGWGGLVWGFFGRPVVLILGRFVITGAGLGGGLGGACVRIFVGLGTGFGTIGLVVVRTTAGRSVLLCCVGTILGGGGFGTCVFVGLGTGFGTCFGTGFLIAGCVFVRRSGRSNGGASRTTVVKRTS